MEFQSDLYIIGPMFPELSLSDSQTETIFNLHHSMQEEDS